MRNVYNFSRSQRNYHKFSIEYTIDMKQNETKNLKVCNYLPNIVTDLTDAKF